MTKALFKLVRLKYDVLFTFLHFYVWVANFVILFRHLNIDNNLLQFTCIIRLFSFISRTFFWLFKLKVVLNLFKIFLKLFFASTFGVKTFNKLFVFFLIFDVEPSKSVANDLRLASHWIKLR